MGLQTTLGHPLKGRRNRTFHDVSSHLFARSATRLWRQQTRLFWQSSSWCSPLHHSFRRMLCRIYSWLQDPALILHLLSLVSQERLKTHGKLDFGSISEQQVINFLTSNAFGSVVQLDHLLRQL